MFKSSHLIKLFSIIFITIALSACGGGGSGGGGTASDGSSSSTDTSSGTDQPAIAGFTLALKTGDYWEYKWDYYSNTWAQGSTSSPSMLTGRYRLTLGTPVIIDGTQAYPVEVTGDPGSGSATKASAPRWKYIAVNDMTLLGSVDGTQLSVIFDAQNGFWPGGGFFVDLGSTALNRAQSTTVSGTRYVKQYISGNAFKTGLSGSEGTCEYYSGVGNICGDSSYSFDRWEYFLPNIGPYGYYYYNTFSDCGGGFCSGATWEQMVGLVSSSLRGDTVDYVLENEPNDSIATAQQITNGVPIMGLARPSFTAGWNVAGLGILASPDINGQSVIEDLYKFTLPLSVYSKTVTISLDFPSAAGSDTDYDIYLLNGTGTSVIDSSTSDNKLTGDYTESITHTLPSGTFLIGIEAYSNSADNEYTLKVSW